MLKSIKLKKFIQILSLILFPVTINYFSPYVSVDGAWRGLVAGSVITFAALLIGAVFFGRLFCSTLCPAGTLGDVLGQVNDKSVKNGKYNLIKWFIWVPWFSILVTGWIVNGIQRIQPLHLTDQVISVDGPMKYIIYFTVVGIFFIINLAVGKRAMCHYGCWMAPFMIIGIQIRRWFRLPGLTLTAEKDACISCKKCNKTCPMSLDVLDLVQNGGMTHVECTLCTQCVGACPKDVIDLRFTRTQLQVQPIYIEETEKN